jgi:hypothetical protein
MLILLPWRCLRSRTFLHTRLRWPRLRLIPLNARRCGPRLRLRLSRLSLWLRSIPLCIALLPCWLSGTCLRLNLRRPVCLLCLPHVGLNPIWARLLWRSRSCSTGKSRTCNWCRYSRQRRWHRPVCCYRPRVDHDRWPSLVLVIELRPVLRSLTLHLYLRSHRSIALLVQHGNFCRTRLRLNSRASSIEAHSVHGRPIGSSAIHHHVMHVHVANHSGVHAIHTRVVVKTTAVPISAVVAVTGVAIAIVDAAVEANMQAPESVVEALAIAYVAPIAGRP